MEELEVNDLKQEIFYSSNIQVENMYNDKQNYMLVTVLNIAFIADLKVQNLQMLIFFFIVLCAE